MPEYSITFYNEESNSLSYDKIKAKEPRQCMHCKNTGKQVAIDIIGTFGKHDESKVLGFFVCPLCHSTTIHYMSMIKKYNESNYKDEYYCESFDTIPSLEIEPSIFTDAIKQKFPSFVKIYSQSEEAQNSKLDHLAGMGYRKALEFLVTDYLIEYPVDGVEKEWLTNPDTRLGNKISKIESKRIQKLAKAISFLGNDETHYTRKHPEYDVNSIKSFIAVLLSEIQNEIDFQEAEKLLNKPKF